MTDNGGLDKAANLCYNFGVTTPTNTMSTMSTTAKTVVIHHLAFHRFNESSTYAKHFLIVDAYGMGVGTPESYAEAAFRDTNHPDINAQTVKKEGRCYSMSTGDFAEVPGGTEGDEPTFWLCCGSGWEQVSKAHMEQVIDFMRAAHQENPERHWTMDFQGVRYLKLLRAQSERRAAA